MEIEMAIQHLQSIEHLSRLNSQKSKHVESLNGLKLINKLTYEPIEMPLSPNNQMQCGFCPV